MRLSTQFLVWLGIVSFLLSAHPILAAAPSAEQALKLAPIQPGVDCDCPSGAEVAKCKISAKKTDGRVGWIVEGPDGEILRRFVDTNGDNIVDQWSYYKDGLEVYRDIDSNFNGKADQYRWFHTGGSRWGLNPKENGTVETWKEISPEEVASEVVAALATSDAERFSRLLLTPAELKSLGLGKSRMENVAEKVAKAAAGFQTLAARQKSITRENCASVQFHANRPGVVPAGTDDSTKDIRVYENVAALVGNGNTPVQVQIGTLVQVGDAWRVIDLPQPMVDGLAENVPSGFFFQASMSHRNEAGGLPTGDASQKLLAELEKLYQDIAKASPEEQNRLTLRQADLLEQIASAAKTEEERATWVRQLADMLLSAILSGTCPEGVDRLKTLFEKYQKSDGDKNLAACIQFRRLTAESILSQQSPKADYAKIQADWIKAIERFIADYPSAPDAAEAMLQLAGNREFENQEDEAKKLYAGIVKNFPESAQARKASGALVRLDSEGKSIALSGKSPLGSPVDLAKYRGKIVLIHFWTSQSRQTKADMAVLKDLWNKYGRSFTIIGVNLDVNAEDLKAYLTENPLPWPQIFEEGGMDSRPANALGIIAVPTMILVDSRGLVVDRNITVADLEPRLKKLIQ